MNNSSETNQSQTSVSQKSKRKYTKTKYLSTMRLTEQERAERLRRIALRRSNYTRKVKPRPDAHIEYEHRKSQLPTDLSPELYTSECQRIAAELGI